MRRLRRYSHAKRAVLVIKFNGDTRYTDGDEISSHDRVTMRAVPVSTLGSIPADMLASCDVIGIDEGQFYADLIEFVQGALEGGKTVIVSALDGDFRRKPFGRVLELIPMAERVDKLSAVCTSCQRDAAFTKRTVASTQLQLVGGAESYQPVCRACFDAVPGADREREVASPKAVLAVSPAPGLKTGGFSLFGSPNGATGSPSGSVSSGGSPGGDPRAVGPVSPASLGAFAHEAMAVSD